ncbi:MAG: tRNA preQ1(34) S-adenosylmethionine ribosyltransferase-isomerase QueA [Treponema sp.]|jgi:S-adenosylmethionine:tRNA ribosyltransferase-isomerase|nr:tRNA preQ1(34) S-adenosylmethionine ribosyltransferase-isomerase QueA [Treponema sp.]
MKTSDFFFELPEHLIAQYPPEQRGQSRLMILNRRTGQRFHRMVNDLPKILCGPELRGKDGALPLLVFNDSKVRKARLTGTALHTGAQVEFLLVEGAGDTAISGQSLTWKVLVQRAKRRRPGSRYAFFDTGGSEIARAEIIDASLEASSSDATADAPTGGHIAPELRLLKFDRLIDDSWLDRYGHIPLPPYIKRQDVPADAERYQTVYAAAAGSTAAPTAGLHFTRVLLDRLAAAGIESAFLTLHVGLGTFLPVRSEHIEDHTMHRETLSVDGQTAAKIEAAQKAGRKIIAVGTTSVRTLESAWDSGKLQTGKGSTSIFIYPGYQFKVVDALVTNFHTPESTLLMLTAAFAGKDLILESYAEAIGEGYRFFSYGDAMLIM